MKGLRQRVDQKLLKNPQNKKLKPEETEPRESLVVKTYYKGVGGNCARTLVAREHICQHGDKGGPLGQEPLTT